MFLTSSLYSITTYPSKLLDYIWPVKDVEPVKQKKKKANAIDKGYLYAFQITETQFKVGKSVDYRKREKPYHTISPDGKMFHTISTEDMHYAERILHDMLKMSGYHYKQEIFNITGPVVVEYMNVVDALAKSLRINDNPAKMQKLVKTINQTRN